MHSDKQLDHNDVNKLESEIERTLKMFYLHMKVKN